MIGADSDDADPERGDGKPQQREHGVEHEHLQKQRDVLHRLHVDTREGAQDAEARHREHTEDEA